MNANDFVARLTKPKQTRRGSWIACCPAHEDRHPSLTVREADDGRILIHCFAGCAVHEIAGALGLGLEDLFPEKPLGHRVKGFRRPFAAADVLECVAHEALIVALVVRQIEDGEVPSDTDLRRMMLATQRLESARSIANG